MSVELGSIWVDNDKLLLVIVKSLEESYDGKVKVVFNYIIGTGDKSVESASELDFFLKTKTKLVKSIEGDYSKGFKKGKEFNKDDQNLNYRIGYNDGWHDCEALSELDNKFTDSIQKQAYEEGYDQAIDDLIEAGVIGEEEYLDDDCSDEVCSEECYSEYEFGDAGDVGDDEDEEEEYCFYKELEKVLNGKFDLNNKSEYVKRKHSHYFKDVRHLDYLDIYQVCKLFEVDDPSHCTQHSIKKLLMSGKRGAKDKMKDIIEARDTLNRYLQIEGIE